MHLAAGASEVIINLSPLVFTALSLSIFYFTGMGVESDDDSFRLTLCAMAPMVIPLKVVTDSLYRYRLYKSAYGLIQDLMGSLKAKQSIKTTGKSGGQRSKKYSEFSVVINNCNFTKDEVKKDSFEEIFNLKKQESELPRHALFIDRLNSNSFSVDVKDIEADKKRITDLTSKFASNNAIKTVGYCLKNIVLKIELNSKICIVGQQNSGKDELFLAIMQELIKVEDSNSNFIVKGNACYLDMNNPKFIRDTIKENILLGRTFVKEKYNELIILAGLNLSKYPLKDRTVIVEG